MRILVDHQHITLYNGEFASFVKDFIVQPLSKSHDVAVSKTENETMSLLSSNKYDVVVITGYSSSTLAYINDSSKTTNIVSVIYDMNAEKLLEIHDSNRLGDVVAYKSRLIFLSDMLLCPSETVKNDICRLYSPYKKLGIDVESKIEILRGTKIWSNDLTKPSYFANGSKYALVVLSNNGSPFLTDDFDRLCTDIASYNEQLQDLKFAIISDSVPQNVFQNKMFVCLKDVSNDELAILCKHSVAALFISSLDTDITKICIASSNDCICLLSSLNDTYTETFSRSWIFFNESNNLAKTVKDIIISSKSVKDEAKKMQKDSLEKICSENKTDICGIFANIFHK